MFSLGADVNTQANDGASALFEASKNGHAEVVEILLSKRADVNRDNKAGLLPIHVAAKNGHDGSVKRGSSSYILIRMIPIRRKLNCLVCFFSSELLPC